MAHSAHRRRTRTAPTERTDFATLAAEVAALDERVLRFIGSQAGRYFAQEVGTLGRCSVADEIATSANVAGFGYHGRDFAADDVVVVLHWQRSSSWSSQPDAEDEDDF